MTINLSEQQCPECGQDYLGLSIESSIEVGFSRITCSECTFHFGDECCEEDLIEEFEKEYCNE